MLGLISTNNVIRSITLLLSYILPKRYIMIIPHSQMSLNDNYSIINYRSDSALSFLHYFFSNNLLLDKHFLICVSPTNDVMLCRKYIKDNFPLYSVEFVPAIDNDKSSGITRLKKTICFYYRIARSSHVFTSQTPRFIPIALSSKIKISNLGYYVAPIKDSTHDKNSPLFINYQGLSKKDYDYYVVTSEVSKRLIMGTYGFKYNQFLTLGLCRNDYLFSSEYPNSLREQLTSALPYMVKKIILYTPTHRDNLLNIEQFNAAKCLFGFDTDLNRLDSFFQKEGIFIICIQVSQVKN